MMDPGGTKVLWFQQVTEALGRAVASPKAQRATGRKVCSSELTDSGDKVKQAKPGGN